MSKENYYDKAIEDLVWKELHICKYKELQISALLSRFKKREKIERFIFWIAFLLLLGINIIDKDIHKISVILLLVLEVFKDVKSLKPTWLGTQYITDLDKKLMQAISLTSDFKNLYDYLPDYGDMAKTRCASLKERANSVFYMGEALPIELTVDEEKEVNRQYEQYDKINFNNY